MKQGDRHRIRRGLALEFGVSSGYGSGRVNPKGLLLARVLNATLCGVVFLHAALAPVTSFRPSSPTRAVLTRSADEGAQEAALKHPDGPLLAAVMQASARARIPHAAAWTPDRDRGATVRFGAWGHGASFSRTYAPLRLRRLFAPPSTRDPEA